MVYKYDEIIAVLQTEGGILDERKQEFKTKRYQHRFDGIYIDNDIPDKKSEAEQGRILENMTPEEFEKNRLEQAMQLYCAYKSKGMIWCIMPGRDSAASLRTARTNPDAVRKVTGKYAERGVYNTDISYLDKNTILGLDAIAWAENQIGKEGISISGISSYQLLEVVDELVAARDIIAKDFTPRERMKPSMRQMATETNFIKRSIGFKKGENVYGIDDYSVTVKQMLSSKTNILKRMYRFLKEKWKEFNKEQNEPSSPNRFGDEEIYLDDREGR